MTVELESAGPLVAVAIAIGALLGGALLAGWLSRWADWPPAGPIALIAAAPLLPHVPLFASLSADDLLPLLGLGMLIWRRPVPRVSSDPLLRIILVAMAVATLARIGTAVVNGGGIEGDIKMLAQAIGRPVVLLGIVAYVAIAAPGRLRQHYVAASVAVVGTFEAAFGLLGFVFRLPYGAGIEAARPLTSLYGACPGRLTGTLGLSANHLGALFVISIPVTIGLALTQAGWRRWALTAASAVQAAALILTFTRSSIVLGVVVLIGFLVYQRKLLILAGVTALTAGIVLSAVTVSCTTTRQLGGRFTDANDRLALWYSAGLIMLDHPIVGVGLDRMNEVVAANPDRYRTTPFGPATSSAHNTILLAGAETGIAGGLGVLGINLGLGLVAMRSAWRGRKWRDPLLIAAALGAGGYLVQGMLNNLFSVPATSAVFALLIGALVGSHSGDGGEAPADSGRSGSAASDPYTSPASDGNPLGGDR